MNVLAVDVSSDNLSLYMKYGINKEANFNRKIKFGASQLINIIDKNLRKFKIDLAGFDFFVVGAGPGSFTGLRISFSVIKALMMAKEKPAIIVPSFYSCAFLCKSKAQKIAVIADARRNLFYLSYFKNKKDELIEDGKGRLVTIDKILKIDKECLIVTYDHLLRERILNLKPEMKFYSKNIYPQAKYLMPLAQMYYNKSKFTPLGKLEPLYLHPKTCQIRRKF